MLEAILGLCVLLASVVLHENSHGLVALALGDDTASKAGRLTPNPIKHLDIVGSLILPLVMFFSVHSMFGWAKPVPVNPAKLQGKDRWGFALVALAGPVSNLVLALIAASLTSHIFPTQWSTFEGIGLQREGAVAELGVVPYLLITAVVWNLLLAAFNLVPIPPLDGSRLIRVFVGPEGRRALDRIEPYGFLILFALIIWLNEPFFRVVRLIESGLLKILPL